MPGAFTRFAPARAGLVSVVIPTKDRPEAIFDAVKSVFESSYQRFELFVVDQSSGDATKAILQPFMSDPRFTYLENRRPGFGAASSRNVGIALSNGEFVAVIDDDVTVGSDWLARIVAEFEADPELEFISGRLAAPPYDPQAGFIPSFDPYPGISNWKLVFAVAGANLSMRRTLFDRVGGYDEFCGPGSRIGASDDGDITLRIVRSGAKWKASGEIEVLHKHGFRPNGPAEALLKRYQRGNGGIFGRQTRRGDLVAGAWFLLRELRHLTRVIFDKVLRRPHASADIKEIRNMLAGFWQGLTLPPKEGFVGPDGLVRLRQDFLTKPSLARS